MNKRMIAEILVEIMDWMADAADWHERGKVVKARKRFVKKMMNSPEAEKFRRTYREKFPEQSEETVNAECRWYLEQLFDEQRRATR